MKTMGIGVRVTEDELRLVQQVTEKVERTTSGLIRLLIRNEAERLGIITAAERRRLIKTGTR